MTTNTHFWSYLPHFWLEWEMFQTKVVDKFKTYILYSVTYFENCALYEKRSKNTLEPGRPQMTIWRMHIVRVRWIPKATNTLRICNTYWFSTTKMDAKTQLNVTSALSSLLKTCPASNSKSLSHLMYTKK